MADERRETVDVFARFCECLNRFEVRYVIVGSEAVAFHGAPRYSADFDTFVSATQANLFRVKAALEVFGLTELAAEIDPEVWAKTGSTLRFGEVPAQVDVLLQLSGVNFNLVDDSAVDGRYGDVPVPLHRPERSSDKQAGRWPAEGSRGRGRARASAQLSGPARYTCNWRSRDLRPGPAFSL